jgi:transposase-like protein
MNDNVNALRLTVATDSALDTLLREGARAMLQQAIEREVADYIQAHQDCRDPHGRRLVVRNGRLPARKIQSGLGPIQIRQPRVNDRRIDSKGERIRFTSKILPPYLRKTQSIEQLVPWLYLKGISTDDFPEALAALGHDGSGLSATNVVRMKELWREEWTDWSKRDLTGKQYAYFWVDGVYFNVRLADPGENRQCILVVIGATDDGRKELVAIQDGHRESEATWLELLRDLKERGLETGPELATGDGALGFWKALPQVFPNTRQQRCWVHKTANVLSALPQTQQATAKQKLQQIWMAETRVQAIQALEAFVAIYQAKYPKAAEKLLKDRDALLTFYDLPADHWRHVRTTNPIESVFATVRLRTSKTKGCGSRQACLTMVFKLAQSAAKRWTKLSGTALILDVLSGVQFHDGIRKAA